MSGCAHRSIEICPNPVFIIGSPRSGTTALAAALDTHPGLWVSKESYFVHSLLGDDQPSKVWQQNIERVTPSWLRHEGVGREEFLAYVGAGFNALYTSRAGGRRWVDQTPRYTTMVAELADLFPGASFLHMLRDGRDVVRSMSNFEAVFDDEQKRAATHEIPSWTNDVAEACRTWERWTRTALDFEDHHPERVMRVVNGRLASDPTTGFERIWRFLGLPADPAPAERFAAGRVNSSFAKIDAATTGWESFPVALRSVFVEVAGTTTVRAGLATHDELARWEHGA